MPRYTNLCFTYWWPPARMFDICAGEEVPVGMQNEWSFPIKWWQEADKPRRGT